MRRREVAIGTFLWVLVLSCTVAAAPDCVKCHQHVTPQIVADYGSGKRCFTHRVLKVSR